MSTGIRFFYLRTEPKTPQDRGNPVACLCVFFNKDTKQVSYGFSTLNPLDTCKKAVAKDLAAGRLIRNPHKVNIWSPSMNEEDITCHYINRRILQDMLMLDRKELPSRARKAAIRWLAMADTKDGYVSLENISHDEKLWDNVKE